MLRPGDQVYHKDTWKTIKETQGSGRDKSLIFDDGSTYDVGTKMVQAKKKPETAGELIDNRDGTYDYNGVTLKKVFGKWVAAKAGDPNIGKNDSLEEAVAKLDALNAPEKSTAPEQSGAAKKIDEIGRAHV